MLTVKCYSEQKKKEKYINFTLVVRQGIRTRRGQLTYSVLMFVKVPDRLGEWICSNHVLIFRSYGGGLKTC